MYCLVVRIVVYEELVRRESVFCFWRVVSEIWYFFWKFSFVIFLLFKLLIFGSIVMFLFIY